MSQQTLTSPVYLPASKYATLPSYPRTASNYSSSKETSVEDGTFLFKLIITPGSLSHRFRCRCNYASIRELVFSRLSLDPFFSTSEGEAKFESNEFVLCYYDDERDLIFISSDWDVSDAVSVAKKTGKDRVTLRLKKRPPLRSEGRVEKVEKEDMSNAPPSPPMTATSTLVDESLDPSKWMEPQVLQYLCEELKLDSNNRHDNEILVLLEEFVTANKITGEQFLSLDEVRLEALKVHKAYHHLFMRPLHDLKTRCFGEGMSPKRKNSVSSGPSVVIDGFKVKPKSWIEMQSYLHDQMRKNGIVIGEFLLFQIFGDQPKFALT